MKADLTFKSRAIAQDFASRWAHKTLSGHDMSATKTDGSVNVTVYDVTDDKLIFINDYISEFG